MPDIPGGGAIGIEPGVRNTHDHPAGTGHRRIASRGPLGVVGAYPEGSDPDLCRPERADTAESAAAVARVPLPACDPVDGAGGRLFRHWPAQ